MLKNLVVYDSERELKHTVIKERLVASLYLEFNLLIKNILLINNKFAFALDKCDFILYNKCNKIDCKNTTNSHITKSNRVLFDTFCNM